VNSFTYKSYNWIHINYKWNESQALSENIQLFNILVIVENHIACPYPTVDSVPLTRSTAGVGALQYMNKVNI